MKKKDGIAIIIMGGRKPKDTKKKNKGANDYRSGGYVLSTVDKRKVKRNGK